MCMAQFLRIVAETPRRYASYANALITPRLIQYAPASSSPHVNSMSGSCRTWQKDMLAWRATTRRFAGRKCLMPLSKPVLCSSRLDWLGDRRKRLVAGVFDKATVPARLLVVL